MVGSCVGWRWISEQTDSGAEQSGADANPEVVGLFFCGRYVYVTFPSCLDLRGQAFVNDKPKKRITRKQRIDHLMVPIETAETDWQDGSCSQRNDTIANTESFKGCYWLKASNSFLFTRLKWLITSVGWISAMMLQSDRKKLFDLFSSLCRYSHRDSVKSMLWSGGVTFHTASRIWNTECLHLPSPDAICARRLLPSNFRQTDDKRTHKEAKAPVWSEIRCSHSALEKVL